MATAPSTSARLKVRYLEEISKGRQPRNEVRHRIRGAVADRAEQVGGVIEKEGPIHRSNVMLADPKDGKPTRVGVELVDGQAHRVAKRSGTRID